MPPAESTEPFELTVIMPGLNEESNIEAAVREMTTALRQLADDWEILIVDDGSTDRTGEIADRLAAEEPRVRVLHNERNVDYGISRARGIAAASCAWILHDGMDLPLAPKDIAVFRSQFAGADVVVAQRIDRSAHSPWRKVTSAVHSLLMRGLFRPKTRDLNFVQFYRRDWAQTIALRSTSPAFVTPELILRAERMGRVVREGEGEFRHRQRGQAHYGRPKDILWTLRDMLALRLHTGWRGWS